MENKYQEALDRLLNDDYDFSHDFYEDDKATAMERDIDTLQELVDKATPKSLYVFVANQKKNGIMKRNFIIVLIVENLCLIILIMTIQLKINVA